MLDIQDLFRNNSIPLRASPARVPCPGAHAVPARLSRAAAALFSWKCFPFPQERNPLCEGVREHRRLRSLPALRQVRSAGDTLCHSRVSQPGVTHACRAQPEALPPHTSHQDGAPQPRGVIGRGHSLLCGVLPSPAAAVVTGGPVSHCSQGVAWSPRWVETPHCRFGTVRLHRANK